MKLYWNNFQFFGLVIYLSPFQLLLCNICIKNKTLFPFEHKIKGRETLHPSVSPFFLTGQFDQIKPYCTKGEN